MKKSIIATAAALALAVSLQPANAFFRGGGFGGGGFHGGGDWGGGGFHGGDAGGFDPRHGGGPQRRGPCERRGWLLAWHGGRPQRRGARQRLRGLLSRHGSRRRRRLPHWRLWRLLPPTRGGQQLWRLLRGLRAQAGWGAAAVAGAAVAGAAVATASYGWPVGATYGYLPADCSYDYIAGQVYYSCGAAWLQPAYGANGLYYRVVPAP